jgi:segregation and condensation protein A
MGIDFIALALTELEKWDSELVDLVRESKINPWDIDITLLTAKYLERIREMDKLDFRIPAKAVITAAVLLKLKSERLEVREIISQARRGPAASEFNLDILSVPDLHPVRRIVERKITIMELVDALRGAFEVEKRKMLRQKKSMKQIGVRITSIDIEAVMRDLRQILDDLFYARETLDFTDLLKYKEFEVIFLALLYLANHGEIEIEQEEWNGPMKIRRAAALPVVEPPSQKEPEGGFVDGR